MRRVVVVGSGVAGTAAALAAAHAGASVTLVAGGTGASMLTAGALDDLPWDDDGAASPAPLFDGARRVLDALGGYVVGEIPALLVATTGVVRPARGADRALLDVAALPVGVVVVADVAHAGWDASTLARAWSASPRAGDHARFVAVPAALLARTEEHAFGDADLAARHDDPARVVWLADRLRQARASFPDARDVVAFVLPPWLGVEKERATELSERVGVPCGEALGKVGGPGGLRFAYARDRALSLAGVRVIAGRASGVYHALSDGEGGWRVEINGSIGPREADAVVLATGGLIGGGLEYTPSGAYLANVLPEQPRPLLRATCDAPVRLGAFGRALREPSSLFGAAPETHAWPYVSKPLLDHAGVMVDDEGRVVGAPEGLHAAGEVVADRSRTWLNALEDGVRAGHAAAGGPA